MKIPSWIIRVHLFKKLIQQKLTANDLPVVKGCPVIMILKFVVNFCFHSIKKEFLCQLLISAISWTVIFWPENCNFEKNANFLTKEKPNIFHLMSIVKKMVQNVFFNQFLQSLKISKSSDGHVEWMFGNLSDEICQYVQHFLLVFRNG